MLLQRKRNECLLLSVIVAGCRKPLLWYFKGGFRGFSRDCFDQLLDAGDLFDLELVGCGWLGLLLVELSVHGLDSPALVIPVDFYCLY
jgi:hypothetical protein